MAVSVKGISTDEMMKSLSDDAKIILGGYFGYGIAGTTTLVFGMKESRPTARAQAALDQLVKAGALNRRDLQDGAMEYTQQVNCSEFGRWFGRNKSKGKWSTTEPIGGI
jgi:hypothetical protein